MRSPFPGMDPYLEARWGTFHATMVGAMMSNLNQVLPGDLEAQIEEQVRVESLAGDEAKGYRPDLAVVDLGPARVPPGASTGTAAAAVEEEITIRYLRAPLVVRRIAITDAADGNRLVTAVELLSPWNKLGGRLNRDYRRKLRDYEASDANWVEVDLLRSSRDRLPVRWTAVPPDRRSTYAVVTFRAVLDSVTLRPVSLRRPLPSVAVPLRANEPEVLLDLQAAFDRSYADGRFKSIDYARPPDPPLADADAAWAAELLANRR